MKWPVTVSPYLAAITISMLSISHCRNQQSKLILLKLLKYSLEWCSLSIFSYEKYRIVSVASCQMHKPTTTKKITNKSNPPLQKEQSSVFTVRTEQFLPESDMLHTNSLFIYLIHALPTQMEFFSSRMFFFYK